MVALVMVCITPAAIPASASTGRTTHEQAPAAGLAVSGPTVMRSLPFVAPAGSSPGTTRGTAGTPSVGASRAAAEARAVGPFDVAGVTLAAPAPAGLVVQLRTRSATGWSAWVSLALDGDEGPDLGSSEVRQRTLGTEAVAAAGSTAVEARVGTTDGRAPKGLTLRLVDSSSSSVAASGRSAAPGLSGDPSRNAADDPAGSTSAGPTTAGLSSAAVAAPRVVTRAQWGADESLMPCQPDPLAGFKAAVVHHTVNTNTYSSSQAAQLVRGIFAYHTQGQGWCDIGYNFLVDRFGTVYEGRKGSISGFTQGAHAGGFNQETFGVSVIGEFTSVSFPTPVRDAVARVIAWEADRAGFDPAGTVTLTSAGSTRYEAGVRVTKPRVMGHRDLSLTSCPGSSAYGQLPSIQAAAGSIWRSSQYTGRSGGFTPVTARRVIDTRSGVGTARGALPAGGVVTFRPSSLPSDVTALTLNLTTTGAEATTTIAAYPSGSARRGISVLNTGAGRTTAASVVVGVGSDGRVTLRNSSAATHLIVDLAGYYSSGSSTGLVGTFRRVLDSRSGLGVSPGRVLAGRPLVLTVPGLPAGARAVNLNLAATASAGAGVITAYAYGTTRPATSNLNVAVGQTVSNLVTVPVDSRGRFVVQSTTTVHLVADLEGAFVTDGGSRFTPVSPRRVLDTRYGWWAPYGPVRGGSGLPVTIDGLPVSASGIALSLTATAATAPTNLTVFASGGARPATTYVNVMAGQSVSALSVSGIRSSGVTVYSSSGSVSLIADLLGFYS